ncbi:hypothetical protein SAURM35S_00354 [Streptomyces aurantiogriseus]
MFVSAEELDLHIGSRGRDRDDPLGQILRTTLEKCFGRVAHDLTVPVAAQDWIPAATVRAEDDGAVLSMVGSGLGMAIMPALSLTEVPPGLRITDLGPARPTRRIGYVTTPELAATAAVRALVRELRAHTKPQKPQLSAV